MTEIKTYQAKNSEIKIVHTADTHLGSRQYHSDIRRQDFFDSFEKVIDDAVENKADAVIHAGDLFDNRNPTIEDLSETILILSKLKEAGIPFLGIIGNHESKQNTQWLDIFESMELAQRLGNKPIIIENEKICVCFYGVDNLSAPRLASFDFSIYSDGIPPEEDGKKRFNILALHQLIEPVLPGQPLSCDDFTSNIPIPFDAVLLGDNHKYECVKHNGAWLTYSGSTERCSAAEEEPRSYSILTFNEKEVAMTRRNIPTRDFIRISIPESENNMESIFRIIEAHSEKIKDAVVIVELIGIKKTLISISEIEDFVKNKGAVVTRVGDKRDLERKDEREPEKIAFCDPDEVVTQELKKLNLTEAGILMDAIIRDSETAKSRIDDESEKRLKEYLSEREYTEEYNRAPAGLKPPEIKEETLEIAEKESLSEQDEKKKESKQKSSPRQYTLGDKFEAEEEK
jgi:DNA repair exonuclease